MADEFDIGDRPRIRVEFLDLSDTLGDPTAVTISVRPPGAAATALTATRVSTGVYDAFPDLTSDGDWGVRGVGTGGLQAAVEGVIKVRPSEVL